MARSNKSAVGGLGLDDIGDLSDLLQQPDSTSANVTGGPAFIELNLIDEDPNQPRTSSNPGFSKNALNELAATIRERNVKSPISIRDNPDAPERYLINHGARRYRAALLANKTSIPAYVDNDFLDSDQMIENIQREALTPREIADYIGRELSKGKKRKVIARELGKSSSFITQYAALLDLPDPIASAFNQGQVNDVTVINDLVKLHKTNPDEVTELLADDTQDVTRGSVKLLRDYISDADNIDPSDPGDADPDGPEDQPPESGTPPDETQHDSPTKKKKSTSSPVVSSDIMKKSALYVDYKDDLFAIDMKRRPSEEGKAWIYSAKDKTIEYEVELSGIVLSALVEL